MVSLLNHVRSTIIDKRLLGKRSTVLAAASGGLDSMVLLNLLASLREGMGWRLEVAHFNHSWRGAESDADEALVIKTCRGLGLECHVGSPDSQGQGRAAPRSKASPEMLAREQRHRFLARIARQQGLRSVVLAHHRDDQTELFLLRVLRGVGSAGLRGMRWISPSPVARSVKLIRPLLDCGRSELEVYARDKGIDYREDRSNRELTIPRNRIRHELLPLLRRDYQQRVDDVILRLMDVVGDEHDLIAELGDEWLGRPEAEREFEDLAPALQREIIRTQLPKLGVIADFQLIENLRSQEGHPISVSSRKWVYRTGAGAVVGWRPKRLGHTCASTLALLTGKKGAITVGRTRIEWRLRTLSDPVKCITSKPFGLEIFDADKVGNSVVVRQWQPGDRFQPCGMAHAAKLQDLFVNAKIPREKRRDLWLGTTREGEIFWVEGLRIGECFKLDNDSTRGLNWVVRRS